MLYMLHKNHPNCAAGYGADLGAMGCKPMAMLAFSWRLELVTCGARRTAAALQGIITQST